ncbi:MAG TPA: CBS domain-containing protein [Steroidobacteraceae bacterium]|nr:CBS domain-containing protein [Steroidobacteraceae bacterium]
MEWIADPTVWVGLATLVALEIVLGVDNLIFIAILAGKLPRKQRDRARIIGLSLALVMRLALLGSITWVMSLTTPLFSFRGFEASWRDLILIAGGLFLLIKATTEIHDRLEQKPHTSAAGSPAGFWPIVAQIVVLDAVFSLDSIITAVGMVDELYVMMAAVVIAVLTMLFASKPLTEFITKRPSLIILCLGFLLMVGLVLVLDGFGLHVPKGYLYAAIGFSLMIEILNQFASRRRATSGTSGRQQMADAVLRILGGVPLPAYALPQGAVFEPAERQMVGGVLSLHDRPVSAIMTLRQDVAWLDIDDPDVLAKLRANQHREFPVGRGSIDKVQGVVRKEDVLALCVDGKPVDLSSVLRPAPSVRAQASILDALNQFKRQTAELAIVADAQGRFQGIVTRNDLLEAIAGEFPDEGE